MTRHTLSVLVENKPGVLARVSSLFSRRGFNIHSLAVGPTENPEVSRMTIVVAVEGLPLEQVTKQLNKLINVLKIVELSPTQAVQRELLLIKLRSDGATRPQIVSIVEMFRARIIDITPDAVTVEATGTSDKLEALVKMLEPFGVRELVQSGMVALGRGTAVDHLGQQPRRFVGTRHHETDKRYCPARRNQQHSPSRQQTAVPNRKQEHQQWPWTFSMTTTPTSRSSRGARSPSSATARRATPTR